MSFAQEMKDFLNAYSSMTTSLNNQQILRINRDKWRGPSEGDLNKIYSPLEHPGPGGGVGNVTMPRISSSGGYDVKAATQHIRDAATKRGIDPDTAVRVAGTEGLREGVWQSNVIDKKTGRREPSFGPWQFLVGGGNTGFPSGMGNQFMAKTGLDPRDPKNVNAMTDFALDHAAQYGWGSWYGARDNGIGNWAGIK